MAFENTPLNGVIEWFLGRHSDRRQYHRRTEQFHLWWHPEQNIAKPGIGMEISPNGLVFIIETPITTPEFNLTVKIRDQKVPIRVKRIRHETFRHKEKDWNRYAVEFCGIAADNWDLIVRYVNDEPEVADRRKGQNQEMERQTDDAYRLLPMAVQQKIIDMLVRQHRLDAPSEGKTPLLKLFYGGLITQSNGKKAHRFNVHSRIKVRDELVAHDTRFLVFEDGTVTQQ